MFVALREGGLVAVGLTDGAVIWDIRQPEGRRLAGGDGLLFLETRDILRCLDAATGVERWRFATEGVVRSSPQVTDQTAYAASSDGHLYALALDGGRLLWKFRLDGPVLAPLALGDGVVGVASEKRTLYVFGRR